jgi:hypothetical protein
MKSAKSYFKLVKGNMKKALSENSVLRVMPFVFFLTFVGIVYITLSYKLERTQKSINRLMGDLEELRTEFIETQTEINTKSIQSEIISKVENSGLKEMTKSPVVIVKR